VHFLGLDLVDLCGTRRLSGGASATEPRVGLKRESLMMGLLTGTLSTGGAPVG
jgi:hypothetical protein